jgi:tRNA1Val (adenine37-N6)-methyltransferase
MEPRKFKGWTIPGPDPAAGSGPSSPGTGETLDALSGYYKIFQLRDGHRFSTDDLLVAWYGTSRAARAERILDLGSGLGTVAMITAWRLPGASLVTIEAQSVSYELSLKSHRLNGLNGRLEARFGDFRDPAVFREGECFDLILGSPPYFPLDAGVLSDHPQKVACRFESRGTVADYLEAAAPRLAPGGMASVVFPVRPVEQHARVVDGAQRAGLVIISERWVRLKEDEEPLLGVFLFMRKEDLPPAFLSKISENPVREPDLVIRLRDGSVSPEYSAIKLSIGFPP